MELENNCFFYAGAHRVSPFLPQLASFLTRFGHLYPRHSSSLFLCRCFFLSFLKTLIDEKLKGTVSRDFRLLVFVHKSFFSKPLSIRLGPFQIFSKIGGDIWSSRCTTGVNDTSGKSKKSSIIKVLTIFFGHLWKVELIYRYIFAFKFNLRSEQPDIVPALG